MNIAICAPFMEADLLEDRIRSAVPEEAFLVDEYYRIDSLTKSSGVCIYDAVWVAYPGALGMEAILAVLKRSPCTPVVWMCSDVEFAYMSFRTQVAMFLMPDSTDAEFRLAVSNIKKMRNRGDISYDHCART